MFLGTRLKVLEHEEKLKSLFTYSSLTVHKNVNYDEEGTNPDGNVLGIFIHKSVSCEMFCIIFKKFVLLSKFAFKK
jgi:hypothetical protein